jgi:mRNA interferase RelE/StbE
LGERSDLEGPWSLRFSRRIIDEDLRSIGHDAFERARRAIDRKLRQDPIGYGAPLRHALTGLYKLKASHLRIVYHVLPDRREVWILMIADRDAIWDRHQPEVLNRLNEMR